jgi:hypothetical protein
VAEKKIQIDTSDSSEILNIPLREGVGTVIFSSRKTACFWQVYCGNEINVMLTWSQISFCYY